MSKRCINCKYCEKIITIGKKIEPLYVCFYNQFECFEITKPYNLNRCKNFKQGSVKDYEQ